MRSELGVKPVPPEQLAFDGDVLLVGGDSKLDRKTVSICAKLDDQVIFDWLFLI